MSAPRLVAWAAGLALIAACGSACGRGTGPSDPASHVRDLLRDGRYQDAEAGAVVLVDAARARAGEGSVEAARATDLLVEALWRGGKAGDPASRTLAEGVLTTKERHLPAGHPEIAASLNNLANLVRLTGDAAGAETMFRRALAMREAALGPEHPDVAHSLTGLAAARLDQGGRDQALALFTRALTIRERALGPDSVEAAQSLNNLAAVARLSGDYAGAQEKLVRVVAIWEERLRPDHPHLGQALENLAQAMQLSGDAAGALPHLERALRIKERTLGPDNPGVAQILDRLGNLRWTLGQAAAAEPLLVRALRIQEKAFEPDHLNVADALSSLGNVRVARGDPAGAKPLLERALAIRMARLGAEHTETANALNNLAIAVGEAGDLGTARGMHERALALRLRTVGPDHVDVSVSLNNLGNVLADLGDLTRAERAYEDALTLRRRILGDQHPAVAETLNNLGFLRLLQGDLPAARELNERALAIRRTTPGAARPELAESLHNLGYVLAELGDARAARPLYEEALAVRRRCLGLDHPDVAATLNLLGNLEFRGGDLAAAATSYRAALAIQEKRIGPDHVATSETLNNLAAVRLREGDAAGARPLFERVLSIRRATYGPDHPQVALVLDNLGAAALRAGDPHEALAFHERAREVWARTVGPDHVQLAATWEWIARARVAAGDWPGAIDAGLRGERLSRDRIRLTAGRLAERRARLYEAAARNGHDVALTALALGRAPGAVQRVFDSVVRSRAMVLDTLIEAQRGATHLDDPRAEALRSRLVEARGRLAALVLHVPDRLSTQHWRELVGAAREEADRAEEALAARLHGLRAGASSRDTGAAEVSAALPPGTALVAYARYYSAVPEDGDAASYLAFVLHRRGRPPAVVPLGRADRIEEAVRAWQGEITAAQGTLTPAATLEARYRAVAERLRAALWDPVAAHLHGAQTVLVVPAGPLSFVGFATLPSGSAAYLADTGPMVHYLSAERDVARRAPPSPYRGDLLVVASPDFGPGAPPQIGTRYRSAVPPFAALPGSLAEASDVARAWTRGRSPVSSRPPAPPHRTWTLAGRDATEVAFRSRVGRYGMLHLATHGFVLGPEATGAQATLLEDNPLVRAGVALAGANQGGTRADAQDGVLTAEEIAALDLSGVDWAVLSACKTGLGEVDAAEGVLGLRRAFQLAGARSVVMSLWSIPDDSTRGWMSRLYAARAAGASTVEACHRASVETLAALRRARRSTHPAHWGAFVAYGAWD